MQIGSAYSTATPRMALIEVEQAGLLDEQQRALVAVGEAGADADAFVLLADADETRARAGLRERPQQAFAGGDVGNRDDELDAARLDLRDDAAPGERIVCRACVHGVAAQPLSGHTPTIPAVPARDGVAQRGHARSGHCGGSLPSGTDGRVQCGGVSAMHGGVAHRRQAAEARCALVQPVAYVLERRIGTGDAVDAAEPADPVAGLRQRGLHLASCRPRRRVAASAVIASEGHQVAGRRGRSPGREAPSAPSPRTPRPPPH